MVSAHGCQNVLSRTQNADTYYMYVIDKHTNILLKTYSKKKKSNLYSLRTLLEAEFKEYVRSD